MRRKLLTGAFVTLVLFAPLVSAVTMTDESYVESFEDYDNLTQLEEDYIVDLSVDGSASVSISQEAVDGSHSLEITQTCPGSGGCGDSVDVTLNSSEYNFSTDETTNDTLSFSIYPEVDAGDPSPRIILQDGTGVAVTVSFGQSGAIGLTTESNSNSQGGYNANAWNNVTIVISYDDDAVYLYHEGDLRGSTPWSNAGWDDPDNLHVRYDAASGNSGETMTARFDDVSAFASNVVDQDLEVEVELYMRPGTTQEYTVTVNETFFNQTTISQDVTNDTNVTSGNTSIITVDDANNELVASSTNSGLVNVTFEYQGNEEIVEIFVGRATIDNFEHLPSVVRVEAVFGGGLGGPNDSSNWGGGQFQFILFATVFGIMAGKAANAFAGIGAVTLVMVIGWFAGWVTTGMMLIAVFFAIFVGLNLAGNIDYSVRT